MRPVSAILAAALLATPAIGGGHQFVNGEAVSLQPDQGYILVRTLQQPGGALRGTVKFTPVLYRVLSNEEIEQSKAAAAADPENWTTKIESNVVEPLADQPYAKIKDGSFLLTSLKPGTYIFGGSAVTNWATKSTGLMTTSLCMGTVKFEVKPGVVTDLGAILNARDDEPTDIPELSHVVLGKSNSTGEVLYDIAIRPSTPASEIPEALRTLPVVAADYRAVSPFPNYAGATISRLVPLAGVLGYDADGNALDLKAQPATSQ